MNTKRALFSFVVAALSPILISIFMTLGEPFGAYDIVTVIGLSMLFYFIYLLIILPVGFISLFLALRIKGGPIFVPPIVGALSGLFFMETLYTPGTEIGDKYWLLVDGIAVAMTAALIYFWPELKMCIKKAGSK
jgi:hypothetical protein